jgi:hypothetical protein
MGLTRKGSPVRVASSLAAASLDGLFEHPVRFIDGICELVLSYVVGAAKWLFNSLLRAGLVRPAIARNPVTTAMYDRETTAGGDAR